MKAKLGCHCLACTRVRTDRRMRREMWLENLFFRRPFRAFLIALAILIGSWRIGVHLYLAFL